MKSLIIVSIFTVLIAFKGFSQKNNGYYGKKAFVDVTTVVSMPLFSNLLAMNQGYKSTGTALITGRDRINYGFRVNLGIAAKRNLAVMLEYGQDYANIYPSTSVQYDYDPYYSYGSSIRHEMMNITSNILIPKIEFATKKSLLPMGLSHQIGLGFSTSKIALKDYTYSFSGYDSNGYPIAVNYLTYDAAGSDNILFNPKKMKPVNKVVLLYALNLRTPLSKSLLLNYGIRYTLQMGKYNYYNVSYDGTILNENELMAEISRQRSFNFISFHIGLTLAF